MFGLYFFKTAYPSKNWADFGQLEESFEGDLYTKYNVYIYNQHVAIGRYVTLFCHEIPFQPQQTPVVTPILLSSIYIVATNHFFILYNEINLMRKRNL